MILPLVARMEQSEIRGGVRVVPDCAALHSGYSLRQSAAVPAA
jgi:hypothetical protein